MRELQIKELMHISGGDFSELAPLLVGVGCLTLSSFMINIFFEGPLIPAIGALAPVGALLQWGIYLVTQN